MAQQTFSGVPGTFAAGAVLTAAEQELIRDYMIAQIKEGMTGDTGEILPMIMDLNNNRVELDSGGLKFADATTQTTAPTSIAFSGTTADGVLTYSSASEIVTESTATYASDTLTLTGSGGGLKMDGLASSDANTLDDYEEGTWTCTLVPASGSITLLGGWTLGSYVKVGRLVTVMGGFYINSVSTPSGTLQVQGLPFAVLSLAEHAEDTVAPFLMRAPAIDLQSMVMIANTGTTTAQVYGAWGDAGDQYSSPAAYIDAGSTQFGVCFSYVAA